MKWHNTKEEEIILQNVRKLDKLVAPQAAPRKFDIIYFNVVMFALLHLSALYGLYLCFTEAKLATVIFAAILAVASMLGLTAGAHRLWSHRSYKVKLPLEILLMIMNTIAFQNTATDWVRNHRLHHKYSDTDADPHNATRGFFYSHIGWLMVRKNEEVKTRGQLIDMSDIYSNPVLRFQKKYAIPWVTLVAFLLPALIPMYFWGETFKNAWQVAVMLRYAVTLNIVFLINSGAHAWGYKPYDKNIKASQNIPLVLLTLGDGFHNFHHVFPWDYRSAELGNNSLNLTKSFIDFFAWIGWAYDLKTVSSDIVKLRKIRTGDGSGLWGWDDKEMPEEAKEATLILNPGAA